MNRRRLLLVAIHYPPIQDSSGVYRSLAFSKYLPEFDWDVSVLTVHARAHEKVLADNVRMIPPSVEVIRAEAWDAARHFSIAGRYPSALAIPDRWSSWIPFGILAGARALKNRKFDAIFSTFPIASAHLIARNLTERTRLPWIADFRDPMVTAAFPGDARMRERWSRIQNSVVHKATKITVTTTGASEHLRQSYVDVPADRFVVIENGYDEEFFVDAMQGSSRRGGATEAALLLHSGVLYREDRDPRPFFRALKRLIDSRVIERHSVHVRLRASGSEDHYRAALADLNLVDVVSLAPPLPYVEALKEMQDAAALLLFQGSACGMQIPAKAYEYLYAGRPIIGLTEPGGDTGRLLRRFGVPGIAPLEDEEAIFEMLRIGLPKIVEGKYPIPARDAVASLSRRAGAEALAAVLDQALIVRPGAGSG